MSTNFALALLKLPSTEVLPESIIHLAIASNLVYLGAQRRLYIHHYDNFAPLGDIEQKWQIPLDESLTQLEIKTKSCFITTKSSLYYLPLDIDSEQFSFFTEKFLPILAFPTDCLVSAIEPQGNWYATSYLPRKSKTPHWQIWQLPNCQLKQSQINRKNWNYLIAIDRRYGLGIYQNQQQQTELHLFNRRGNWLANKTIAIQFNLVVFNPQFPQYLIATDSHESNSLVIITLKKFQIQRIALNIIPKIITACPQGYLISDRQNSIVLINGKDFNYQQLQLSLPKDSEITAMQSSKTQLLVATSDRSEFLLHQYQLPN